MRYRGNAFRAVLAAILGSAIMLLAAASASAATTTVVVQSIDLESNKTLAQSNGKWHFHQDQNDTVNNMLGTFVLGPGTAPLGSGSAQISTSGDSRPNLATYRFSGTKLADITALGFSTYNPSAGNGGGSANRSGYLHFNVDFDASDTWQRRLIYLPSDNGTIMQDTWQAWDAIMSGTALWRYSGPTWPGTATPGLTPRTWTDILTSYQNARMRVTDSFLGIRVGEPYPDGYTENIDRFVFGTAAGTTIFDFEPPTVDLSVTKTDNRTHLKPGVATTYAIVVANGGRYDVSGITVADNLPDALTDVKWTCTASVGSSCPAAMGTNTLNHTGGLVKSGGTLTYQLTGTLRPTAVQGTTFANKVTVTTPVSMPDTDPMNNTVTDTNTVDTRAPEVEISFNPTTRDVEVRGRDEAGVPVNPVPATCTAPSRSGQLTCMYRVVDGAGNATTLTLLVSRSNPAGSINVTVSTLSYNGAVPVRPLTNSARFDFSPAAGTLTRLVQTMNAIEQFAVAGTERRSYQVIGTYANPPGSTNVQVRQPVMSSSTHTGLALIKLVSQNGGLSIETP